MSSLSCGDWVIVIYKGEKFIGKVVTVVNGQAAVQCLTKPLGINVPQDFEKNDSVFYKTVYYTLITPRLVPVSTGWKWMIYWCMSSL